MTIDDPYPSGLADFFKQNFEKAGGKIAAEVSYCAQPALWTTASVQVQLLSKKSPVIHRLIPDRLSPPAVHRLLRSQGWPLPPILVLNYFGFQMAEGY